MNVLSVENLEKSYGEKILFQNVTFGLDQGQKVALVAKNGAGKTTLLRCLCGMESADQGNIVTNTKTINCSTLTTKHSKTTMPLKLTA
ncbi:MAG: ATP-binding cassette domain-containing protein [Flavobacteriia bacterium]|nr:ATP-binding cassette domain-containing protein [Flavobacteriia bacterium]